MRTSNLFSCQPIKVWFKTERLTVASSFHHPFFSYTFALNALTLVPPAGDVISFWKRNKRLSISFYLPWPARARDEVNIRVCLARTLFLFRRDLGACARKRMSLTRMRWVFWHGVICMKQLLWWYHLDGIFRPGIKIRVLKSLLYTVKIKWHFFKQFFLHPRAMHFTGPHVAGYFFSTSFYFTTCHKTFKCVEFVHKEENYVRNNNTQLKNCLSF